MRKTEWIPFGTYRYAYTDYIVFARKNLKTGMIYFKTKIATGAFTVYRDHYIPTDLIDTKAAWDKIISLK